MTDYVPSTPDPEAVTLIAAFIRQILAILSGFGLMVGAYNDSQIATVAAGLVSVGTIVWSLRQKFVAARADHAGSVASAVQGTPVKPVS